MKMNRDAARKIGYTGSMKRNPYPKKQQAAGYRAFLKDLKAGALKPVLFFSGEEEYLIRWAVQTLKKHCVPDSAAPLDYEIFDEDTPAEKILGFSRALSLMSEKKVGWARNWEPLTAKAHGKSFTADDEKAMKAYLSDPNERTILIFSAEAPEAKSPLVKLLKEHAGRYAFGRLDPGELKSFAAKRFRAEGLQITNPAMNLLVESTGYYYRESEYGLDSFSNDIAKIIAHCDGRLVREEDVAAAVSGEEDRFIFDLLDGISANDKRKAFEILNARLSRSAYEAAPLAARIVSQMELLLTAGEFLKSPEGHIAPAEAARRAGVKEYPMKKAMNYAQRIPTDRLREMLLASYRAHEQIVTGKLDGRTALELFIAEL